jgi:hypothetical protein
MNCKVMRILVMYINENLSKIKIKFKRFLFDHQNPHQGLKLFESYFSYQFIIASNSFSDYVSRNISTKRKVISRVFNFVLWIHFLKFLILYFIQKPWIWMFFGDPLFLFGRSDLVALLLGLLCVIVAFISKSNYSICNSKFFHKII